MARSPGAKSNAKSRKRAIAGGYRWIATWVPARLVDSAHAEAQRLNVSKQTVLSAFFEVGQRTAAPSDIVGVDKRWHSVMGYPIGPLWKGALFEPPRREQIIKVMAEGRRIRMENIRARKEAKA